MTQETIDLADGCIAEHSPASNTECAMRPAGVGWLGYPHDDPAALIRARLAEADTAFDESEIESIVAAVLPLIAP